MKRGLALTLLALTIPACLHAQALAHGWTPTFSEPRILFDAQLGDYQGLGFGPPRIGWALDGELPLGPAMTDSRIQKGARRFEYQPSVVFSRDTRAFAYSGHDLNVRNEGIVWINHRVGAEGGLEYAVYWDKLGLGTTNPATFYTLHKSDWVPRAGAVFRDGLLGRPGRLYVDYLFPTGCQWATPSNPCFIQSTRTHGVDAMQEFRLKSFLRIGGEFAVVRYDDPSNQNEPTIPRVGHTTAYGAVHFKFEWPFVPIRSDHSY
jgi:hypothetical protein